MDEESIKDSEQHYGSTKESVTEPLKVEERVPFPKMPSKAWFSSMAARAVTVFKIYITGVYSTIVLLLLGTILLLAFAVIFQSFAKKHVVDSGDIVLDGPAECKNQLDSCYSGAQSSSKRNLCLAVFKQCASNHDRIGENSKAMILSDGFGSERRSKEDTECSNEFKECLIEASQADKRIRKYYFEGCLDNLKSCMKRENLMGKVGTCLAITGVCVVGTFYIPPEAVFVCSGVAATCATYTVWSSFF